MPASAVRLLQVVACLGGAGALSIALAACGCPPPKQLDQVFLLDATAGTPVITPDAGPGAMSIDLDCTPAASGCVPGGDCLPACNCVLARDQAGLVLAIHSCKLLVGAGPPQVEVRYELHVACPPY